MSSPSLEDHIDVPYACAWSVARKNPHCKAFQTYGTYFSPIHVFARWYPSIHKGLLPIVSSVLGLVPYLSLHAFSDSRGITHTHVVLRHQYLLLLGKITQKLCSMYKIHYSKWRQWFGVGISRPNVESKLDLIYYERVQLFGTYLPLAMRHNGRYLSQQ